MNLTCVGILLVYAHDVITSTDRIPVTPDVRSALEGITAESKIFTIGSMCTSARGCRRWAGAR